ncbi:ribonuclease R [Catenovulum sediminis]|uniref:Ribonuclease R n=1 Tax=Catenovulum sediminis TaxID=1740262 RepID=A0ABV1RLW7_9ALTE
MNYNPTAQPSNLTTYENPIPGREFILSLFGKMKQYLNREQIAQALDLAPEQKEALRRRLRAMERDGQLSFTRNYGYQLIAADALVTGVIKIHPDGFGFVSHSASEKDLFLPKNQLTHVFDGDLVQVLQGTNDEHKRAVHKLIKVLERNTVEVVGKLKKQGENYFLQSDNVKFWQSIQVDKQQLMSAKPGEYVNTRIIQYPNFRQTTLVKITEVLGAPQSIGMETKLALRKYGLIEKWDSQLLQHAKTFGHTVASKDMVSRTDFRSLPFVTIDGADAKDFDDAVYCQQVALGGWRLWVAIADVSHYVKPGDCLDVEAQSRATSIYCPGQVIPMLPESLSNGLCSLNPHQDRLVLVCEMTIDDKGNVLRSEFIEGLIRSHARLTYQQANAILVNPQSKTSKKVIESMPVIATHLKNLHALYLQLSAVRQQRGAIEFETKETTLKLNKNRKIVKIDTIQRNDAHRMIEAFMLCANVAAGTFLAQHKIPSLFRIHAGPQQKKLTALRAYLAQKGLALGGAEKPSSNHYNELLNKIKHRDDASVIRTLLLRSQSQAEYSADNQGHFGLAYETYAHFTSPIRRYPDLLTHRAIRAKIRSGKDSRVSRIVNLLTGGRLNNKALERNGYPYNSEAIAQLSKHCSNQSRQAEDVSREVAAALKCQYMQQFIGNQFDATISGVTSFGIFVTLDDSHIEGLIPLSSLNQHKCHYDAEKLQLTCGRLNFAMGDKVVVVLRQVDTQQKKIDFSLLFHT